MKRCPHCKTELEDQYDICWNCQYSFSLEKVLRENDFKVVCPSCQNEIDPALKFCPYCKHDLTSCSEFNHNLSGKSALQIDCLRCHVPMSFGGNKKFHEGPKLGAMGDLLELFENRESFDMYYCSKCGKIEFFLPYADND